MTTQVNLRILNEITVHSYILIYMKRGKLNMDKNIINDIQDEIIENIKKREDD